MKGVVYSMAAAKPLLWRGWGGLHLGSTGAVTDINADVSQTVSYAPFGEVVSEYIRGNWNDYTTDYLFNAKELDEESGMYYYSARYYAPPIFTARDPLEDKYPGVSPYAYCADNPLKYIDPTGMTIEIAGDEASTSKALEQMQSRSKNLTFSRDENGMISATGEAKTEAEKYMMNIINDKKVNVKIQAQTNNRIGNNKMEAGGAFMGNTVTKDENEKPTHVDALQIVNVNSLANTDERVKNPGNMIWHEIAEGFEGGLLSLTSGNAAVPKIRTESNSIYNQAHYNAGAYFPGTIVMTPIGEATLPTRNKGGLWGFGKPRTIYKFGLER